MKRVCYIILVCWLAHDLVAAGESVAWRPARSVPRVRLHRPQPLDAGSGFQASIRPAALQASERTPAIIRAQGFDPVPPVTPPPPSPGAGGGAGQLGGEEPYNCAVPTDPLAPAVPGSPETVLGSENFLGIPGYLGSFFGSNPNRAWFQSDHAFDSFISPVTNPFLAEDPRALTELRPVFIHQESPRDHPIYRAGDINALSLQGRVAFTDRISLVISKLGWVWNEPHNPIPPFATHAGFSELWFGPKFTVIRNETTKTLGAFGMQFQLPIGDSDVFQNTGDLSIVPYFSIAQQFWETAYGRFHVMNTTGYSFATDSARSEYLYSSLHLDFEVGCQGRWYPFVELNWFLYTNSGDTLAANFEGKDIFNFGSRNVSGNNDMSIAFGTRFKITEMVQLGGAFEFPLLGRQDLMEYRFTVDLILRY